MIKSTTFLAFLFFTTTLFAQGLQYEKGINDTYYQEIQQVANFEEFTYLLVQYDYHNVYLEKLDTLGNRLAKESLSTGSGYAAFKSHRMTTTADGNIWISGFGLFGCDIPIETHHVGVFSPNCQLLASFDKHLNFNAFNTHNYKALTAISDTSVAVNYTTNDSSWIEILSPQTQVLLPNVEVPSLIGFGKNSTFYILGHTQNKIYGIDNQGILLDSLTLPTNFSEIRTWNDTIFALGSDVVFKITQDLQNFTTHALPNFSSFSRLKVDAQGVRFISSNTNKSVHHLDHNLNPIGFVTVPVFASTGAIFDFDKALSLAKNFGLSIKSSIRIANYSLSTPHTEFVKRADVAVVDIQLYDVLATNLSFENVYTLSAKANVLVKNNGPNTVNSLRLNHFVSVMASCGDNYTSVLFTDLNLASGDSMWIDFGALGAYTNIIHGDSISRNYCVYSSNPNGVVDLNVPNDIRCKSQFFGFVDLEEKEIFSFKVAPNPANESLYVSTNIPFTGQVIISDQMGRTVLSTSSSDTISLSTVKAGIYFVRLIDSDGKVSKTQKPVRN